MKDRAEIRKGQIWVHKKSGSMVLILKKNSEEEQSQKHLGLTDYSVYIISKQVFIVFGVLDDGYINSYMIPLKDWK